MILVLSELSKLNTLAEVNNRPDVSLDPILVTRFSIYFLTCNQLQIGGPLCLFAHRFVLGWMFIKAQQPAFICASAELRGAGSFSRRPRYATDAIKPGAGRRGGRRFKPRGSQLAGPHSDSWMNYSLFNQIKVG